jgi:hypothetical protein
MKLKRPACSYSPVSWFLMLFAYVIEAFVCMAGFSKEPGELKFHQIAPLSYIEDKFRTIGITTLYLKVGNMAIQRNLSSGAESSFAQRFPQRGDSSFDQRGDATTIEGSHRNHRV